MEGLNLTIPTFEPKSENQFFKNHTENCGFWKPRWKPQFLKTTLKISFQKPQWKTVVFRKTADLVENHISVWAFKETTSKRKNHLRKKVIPTFSSCVY